MLEVFSGEKYGLIPITDNRCSRSHRSNRMKYKFFLLHAVLLSILILCMAACGRQKARVEAPRSPSSIPSQIEEGAVDSAPPEPWTAEADRIPPSAAETGVPPLVGAESDKGPSIRIGLTTDANEVIISADNEYYFLENKPEALREPVRGQMRIRVERESVTETPGTCYRIQAVSLRNRQSAEELREQLEETYKVPVILSENSDATSNRIRLGEFTTRAQAQDLLETLKVSGYPDAFIIGDVSFIRSGKSNLALRGPDGLFKLSSTGYLIQPSSDNNFISFNGKAYRGLLEVRINGSNRITVINQLSIEDYLLGVVPAEISPSQFPQFEALAAQAIAARTYALKHLGQYRSQGFDLTDDDRTQVYGGVSFEKEATNEVVHHTAGLSIYYDNELIDAMYMSTCGGRTEDSSEVFGTTPVPYLTSVVCTSESSVHDHATIINGYHRLQAPIHADDGNVANRDLELALVMGMVEDGIPLTTEYLDVILSKDEAVRLIRNAQRIIDRPSGFSESVLSDDNLDTRIGFLQSAAEFLFGPDAIRRGISTMDAAYYMDNLEDGDTVPEHARTALAFLMQQALWQPFADNTVRPNDPISRREGFSQLLRWTESIKPDILRQGIFAGNNSLQHKDSPVSDLHIKWGNSVKIFPLSENLFLFRRESGRKVPVNSIKIIGNERIYFYLGPDETIHFLEVELNPTGASSDRYSSLATWETTLTRSDIGSKLSTLARNVGEFRELEPSRIGKSGRVVQIRIVGSRSSVEVNGYRFRGALGLRDTLYTITRKKDPAGGIASFTFHGRGYGHGIGLCQVGAFGMAKAGKSYEEILKTYYQGVELRKAY